jgi:zinc D-Ala-D-Ala carboxypeptidase
MAKANIIKRKIKKRKIRRMLILGGITCILSTILIKNYIITQNIKNQHLYVPKEENNFESETTNNNNIKNIILVNKDLGLEKEYEPEDLVQLEVKSNKEILLRKEANDNLKRMFEDAKKDGIDLLAVSGYRSEEYQENVYNNEVYINGKEYADMYVAKPGYSEHQTGLSVDVLAVNYTYMDENFENTEECIWLHENMHKYGFILRYMKGKENITGYNYEPWHIRYVGTEYSYEIKEKGLTLDEYLGA